MTAAKPLADIMEPERVITKRGANQEEPTRTTDSPLLEKEVAPMETDPPIDELPPIPTTHREAGPNLLTAVTQSSSTATTQTKTTTQTSTSITERQSWNKRPRLEVRPPPLMNQMGYYGHQGEATIENPLGLRTWQRQIPVSHWHHNRQPQYGAHRHLHHPYYGQAIGPYGDPVRILIGTLGDILMAIATGGNLQAAAMRGLTILNGCLYG